MMELNILHLQRSRDLHAIPDRPCDRAKFGMESMHAFRSRAFLGCKLEMIGDVNAFYDQHIAFFFNLAPGL